MTEISKLYGKMVITKDAFTVGEITGAEMNDDWWITHIEVKLTKEAMKITIGSNSANLVR